MKAGLSLLILALVVTSCASASYHRSQVQNDGPNSLTVGKVQREISVGMSSAQVVETLGSPNVVTTDEQRREVWVYDKVATEAAYSTGYGSVGGAVGAGGAPGPTLILGGLGGSYGRNAGAVSSTQKTLTIIIKFDVQGLVRDFAYHSSKF
jgi:outer membrane protein assembly factor BamE (lipoprotein component of BamABCDE complex)